MKADTIAQRILFDARKAAGDMLDEANARAAALRGQAESDAAKRAAQALDRANTDAALLRDRMLRMAELEQRKEQLAMKRELVERSFQLALQTLVCMPVEKAREFNEKLILSAAQGEEELIISEADEPVFSDEYMARLNQKLAGRARLTLAGERKKERGGFILRHGGMEVNCEYHAVVSQLRPSLEAEVARMLFQ